MAEEMIRSSLALLLSPMVNVCSALLRLRLVTARVAPKGLLVAE